MFINSEARERKEGITQVKQSEATKKCLRLMLSMGVRSESNWQMTSNSYQSNSIIHTPLDRLRLKIVAKQFSQISVCMEEMRFHSTARTSQSISNLFEGKTFPMAKDENLTLFRSQLHNCPTKVG